MAETNGLLNRRTGFTCTASSNLALSVRSTLAHQGFAVFPGELPEFPVVGQFPRQYCDACDAGRCWAMLRGRYPSTLARILRVWTHRRRACVTRPV